MITDEKLRELESELRSLKSLVITFSQSCEPKKVVEIKGLLDGVEVSEEDIEESIHSLFD
ncbi:MAG: hypothetical protein KJ905_02400 [Nanoarchaeota archaeon]|nr:hypothetical protein [Nanoarchaeota archaeon]MBU1501602.1 hypothetical protein [Nanoarchaeota archaeon]MBU2459306.1 hypothetical protein [Nanoarchaeota archaeon]